MMARRCELEEEVVLITGCSTGGIGWALALTFADRGFQVVATSRSLKSMEDLQNHPRITTCALDVTVDESIVAAVDFVKSKYGRIDILVNNAGILCVAPVAELPLPLLAKSFETNLYGPTKLIQAVTPHLIAKGKGKIVNIGSIAGIIHGPWYGAYNSSKAALHALTDALRMELKPFGIDVILIVAGEVVSNIGKNSTRFFNLIPPLNIYKGFEKLLYAHTQISQGARITPTEIFAKKAVDAILQKKPPIWFTYGSLSTIFRVLYYAPLWVQDWIFSRFKGVPSSSMKKNV